MKEVARNKRAYFDYEILEKFEAGISLLGREVKSVKSGRINLAGSYAILRGGEVWLVGADIPPYQPRNAPQDYDSQRTRKLLLTEKEIKTLMGEIKGTSLTLVPLRSYIKGRLIKVELGLGKGRKKTDKRELIKKRETEREMRRTLRK